MKLILKITKIFMVSIIFTTIPIVIITLISSKTPVLKGLQSFVVLTGSMTPTIPVGSVVYTIHKSSYQKGDIIAFKEGDVTVTHRIVKVESQNGLASYQTKGDANNSADSKLVSNSNVFGKEIIFAPYLGRVIVFLKTPFAFFYVILFPMVVFVIMEAWNLKKEIEKEAEKKFRKKMEQANSHPYLHTNQTQ